MNNRRMVGRPMSMKRFPFRSAERRDNGPTIDMDMTSTRDGPTIDMDMTSTERRDGPTIDMDMTNTGRRASTDYEYYEDIFEYYDAMCDLGGSVVWNVVLKWACAEPYYKRDETGSGADNFFEIATEISKEIKEAIEKETKHLEEKCDPDIFCSNLPDVCAAMESEYY